MILKRRTFLDKLFAGSTAFVLSAPISTRLFADNYLFAYRLTTNEWLEKLSPEQFEVLRMGETESPGSSELLFEKRSGTYHCAGCQQAVFSSSTKYDSGTGWPSFWSPIENAVGTREGIRLARQRQIEVHCANCGGHLGHIKPTPI